MSYSHPSVLYFVVDFTSKDHCERLHQQYIQGKFLGKGAYGSVYEACIKGEKECKYVLKVCKYDHSVYEASGKSTKSQKDMYQAWYNEVSMHLSLMSCQKSFGLQFVPHIYDGWFCRVHNDEYFYTIMEKFDGNLYDFMKKFQLYDTNVKILLKSYIKVNIQVIRKALHHIHNQCSICINDIKLDNMLYRQQPDNTFLIVFTDFGFSKTPADTECIANDKQRIDNAIQTLFYNLGIEG